MPKVFLGLSCGLLAVLIGAAGIGLLGDRSSPDRHILLAVFALLLSCLIQVVVFTYLTVTGKMVIQALHLGGSDLTPLECIKQIKRTATRLVGLIVAVVVPAVATGASLWRTEGDGQVHLLTAGIALVGHVYVLYREYTLIVENKALVDSVLLAYRQARPAAQ